jgi:asparagine synthase (glutamine-hydrolysing)
LAGVIRVERKSWAGVVSRDGSPPEALLERMHGARAADVLSWRTERGAAALGPQVRRSDLVMARVNGLLLSLDGRLDNRAELADALRLPGHTSLPRLLHAAYVRWGFELPAHLDGDFALVICDAARVALLLARDAVGARPLYYAEASGSIAFAPALACLRHALTRTPAPRLNALTQLLCAPHALPANETFLSGIQALPPAHVLISTSTGTQVDRYWQADGLDYIDLDFEECVEEFGRLFRAAVRKRLAIAGRTAVLVSGGLDSSSILCQARDLGGAVVGIYHGARDGSAADETSYIEQLTRAGLAIECVPLEPLGYPEHVPAAVRESEAPLADHQPALHERVVQAARAAGATVILNGTWADQVLFPFPPGYYIDALRGLQWYTLLRHLKNLPAWFADVPRGAVWSAVARHLVRSHVPEALPHALRRLRPVRGVMRMLSEELLVSARGGGPVDLPWSSMSTAHGRAVERHVRSRANTLTLEWYAKSAAVQGVLMALPFLDRALLTLLVTTPGIQQYNGGTPKALLREGMRGMVPAAILDRRDKGDYSAVAHAALQRGAQQVFDELRTGRALACGLLDGQLFSGDLALLQQRAHIGASDAAHVLASLFAVECWLRHFCAA